MTAPSTQPVWWEHLTPPVRDALAAPIDCDVAIVGAGFTGLWTAFYLLRSEPSLRVVVLEREHVGFGASGRNGGWCSALFPSSLEVLAERSGADAAVRMQSTMDATVTEVGRIVRDEGWDVSWSHGGTMRLARSTAQVARAVSEVDEMRRWGFGADDVRYVDAEEARAICNATEVLGGVFTPHCAAVNPAALVTSLATAVEASGGVIYEQTPVTAIDPGRVRTLRGDVHAPITVRATEAYTGSLKGLHRTVVPVYSLMIATEPLPAQVWSDIGLADRPTFTDGRHLIIYGQRTADDRLAFGGRGAPYHVGSRISPEFDRDPRVHTALWQTLIELFPVLRPYSVTHTWGGPLGIARDWSASCGIDARGSAWAGGYVGDGVGTSNLAGRTLTDLILGRSSDLVTLPWVQHRSRPWEPEPIRWAGINIGLRAMTHADRVERRTGRPSALARAMTSFLGH